MTFLHVLSMRTTTPAQGGLVAPTLPDVDVPSSQAVYSGTQTLHGWVFDAASGIVSVDGNTAVSATYGASRSDACSGYGLSSPCPNIGWSVPFDTTTLSNGPHTFVITSTTTDQVPRQSSRTIVCIVANTSPVKPNSALAPNLPKKDYIRFNQTVIAVENRRIPSSPLPQGGEAA